MASTTEAATEANEANEVVLMNKLQTWSHLSTTELHEGSKVEATNLEPSMPEAMSEADKTEAMNLVVEADKVEVMSPVVEAMNQIHEEEKAELVNPVAVAMNKKRNVEKVGEINLEQFNKRFKSEGECSSEVPQWDGRAASLQAHISDCEDVVAMQTLARRMILSATTE